MSVLKLKMGHTARSLRQKFEWYRRGPPPYGMIIVSSFILNNNNSAGIFTITSKEFASCPLCKSELIYRDSKSRESISLSGEVRNFLLRRLRCENQDCKKLHTELPDIIQPYRHYDSDAIQSVLDDSEDGETCVADDSTIRRWKTEFAETEPDINQRLASVYARVADEKVPIADTVNILDKVKIKIARWLAFVMKLLINPKLLVIFAHTSLKFDTERFCEILRMCKNLHIRQSVWNPKVAVNQYFIMYVQKTPKNLGFIECYRRRLDTMAKGLIFSFSYPKSTSLLSEDL